MGNSNNQENSIVVDSKNWLDWTKVEEQGHCQLWMHKQTGKQLQAHPIPESFVRNTQQLKKYYFRKINNTNLVTVQALVTPSDAFLCSQPRMAYALIENIPCRLERYRGCLNFQQVMYVLSTAAAGYNTLNSFFGPLMPHENMICFNQNGNVKVWLNQNLSLNEPSPTVRCPEIKSDDIHQAQQKTKQCVDKLIRIVQSSAAQPFPQDFREQSRQVMTYFEIVNLVSYYCQKNGIDLPQRIVVPKVFQNPPFGSQKQIHRQTSLQNIHQVHNNQNSNLDVSRVRTVVYRSSQTQPHFQSASALDRPMAVKHNSIRSSIAQPAGSSPKITFNIRSTLPTRASQMPAQQFQRKAVVSPPPIFSRVPPPPPIYSPAPKLGQQVVVASKGQISPPQQHVVMRKVDRKPSTQIQEQSQLQMTFNPAQHNQRQANVQEVHVGTRQVIVKQQRREEKLQVEETKESKINQLNQDKLFSKDDQRNVVEINSNSQQQLKSEENNRQEVIELTQRTQKQQSQTQKAQVVHEEGPKCQEVADSLSKPQKQLKEEQNVALVSSLEYKFKEKNEEKQPMSESEHSQIQQYQAPSHFNVKSPIIERQEQYFTSPRKQSSQIEQWEARLNKFTQSQHSQNQSSQLQVRPPSKNSFYEPIHEQKLEVEPPKEVEIKIEEINVTDKQCISQPEEPRDSELNPLANLEAEDIQQYIRAKFNLTQNEQEKQTYSQICKNQPIRKIQSKQETQLIHHFQPKVRDVDYDKYDKYRFKEDGHINEVEKEKENYYPAYMYTDAESISNRLSIQVQKDEYPAFRPHQTAQERTFNRPYQTAFIAEERTFKKPEERKRYRTSNTTNIQERYNKYVVHGQKSKITNKHSRLTQHKDVSLILAGEQSHISKISPKRLTSELDQSIKRGINAFIDHGVHNDRPSDGVTYQRLRRLLLED